jgi:hypothetical protein
MLLLNDQLCESPDVWGDPAAERVLGDTVARDRESIADDLIMDEE